MTSEQLKHSALLVGLERVTDEDASGLSARLLEAQNSLKTWAPAVCLRLETGTLCRGFILYKEQHGFSDGRSTAKMVSWARVVLALNAEFLRALEITQNILEAQMLRGTGLVLQQDDLGLALAKLSQDLSEGGCWTAEAG